MKYIVRWSTNNDHSYNREREFATYAAADAYAWKVHGTIFEVYEDNDKEMIKQ